MRLLIFLICIIYFINAKTLLKEKKSTCQNIRQFQYDEWEVKQKCPNPNVPIINLQNNPRKGCQKVNPIRERMMNKESDGKQMNFDPYQQYLEQKKKKEQEQKQREDL